MNRPPLRLRRSSMARTIRLVTDSGDPVPDTWASWPRSWYQSISGAVWIS